MTDLALERAESAYKSFVDNAFWILYTEELDKYLQALYEFCGNGKDKTENELRFLQGRIDTIKTIKTKPDSIIKEIRKKLAG